MFLDPAVDGAFVFLVVRCSVIIVETALHVGVNRFEYVRDLSIAF